MPMRAEGVRREGFLGGRSAHGGLPKLTNMNIVGTLRQSPKCYDFLFKF
ncbi:hypothetical protein SBF1_1930013 [Candidatus Desulfosporosinus infrequens]|uniref:Uncharacterized protein n=1 Tax=Candidatus Desulfosporosinus infrequens TaxID=2043169 RepID=A0A2U3KGH8_9FIRM|nr:hypothetical protein SBF1_1930013 [Candidatus Desulfosporosinus infrequens]